jgi:hypothetical protein
MPRSTLRLVVVVELHGDADMMAVQGALHFVALDESDRYVACPEEDRVGHGRLILCGA